MATSKGGYVSGGFDILKAPNAPTITSVTTGIGSATVAFTAPTDVGGGAITSYTITAVDESTGASTGATGSASPITISPGGGTFKIRAAATNIYGPGRVSQYETGKQIYSGVSLWAWGYNNQGQLGQNDTINRSSPVQVGSLTNWYFVDFCSAIKADGTLWAWGVNSPTGAVGDGTNVNRSSPVQIGSLTNWSTVSRGNDQTGASRQMEPCGLGALITKASLDKIMLSLALVLFRLDYLLTGYGCQPLTVLWRPSKQTVHFGLGAIILLALLGTAQAFVDPALFKLER